MPTIEFVPILSMLPSNTEFAEGAGPAFFNLSHFDSLKTVSIGEAEFPIYVPALARDSCSALEQVLPLGNANLVISMLYSDGFENPKRESLIVSDSRSLSVVERVDCDDAKLKSPLF